MILANMFFPPGYYIVVIYRYKAGSESSIILMNLFVSCPAHSMKNLRSYEDPHDANALNKQVSQAGDVDTKMKVSVKASTRK